MLRVQTQAICSIICHVLEVRESYKHFRDKLRMRNIYPCRH